MYCRKSSEGDERQVQSLDDQQRELKGFVERFNNYARDSGEKLNVVEILTESHSAKHEGQRQVFNEMIEKAAKGSYDCILIWDPARLTRNVGDLARVLTLLEAGKLKKIRTRENEFGNDPFQKFMLVQATANAKLENDQKGVNVVRGLKTKIRDGNWIGCARLGYQNFGDKKGKRWVDKDPERWDIVRRCWELFATGAYSVPEIKAKAEEWGLHSKPTAKKAEGSRVGINTYYGMFREVFYTGKMQVGKEAGVKLLPELKEMILRGEMQGEISESYVVVKGNHPPMVSDDLFYRVQQILKSRGLDHHCATPRIKDFLFAGLILCGTCRFAVVMEEKSRYKCSHCRKWMTHSNTKLPPTHCKNCQELLTQEALDNHRYHCYAHCSGKKNGNKICVQTYDHKNKPKYSVQVADLEAQVDETLSRLEIDEETYSYCIEMLKDEHFQNKILQNNSLAALQKDQKLIKNKLDNLVEMRLNKEIDGDLFATKKTELEASQKEVMKQLEKFNQKNTDWVEHTEAFLNAASRARYAFKHGDKQTKREILRSIGSNLFLEGGKLRFEFRKPFDILLKEPPTQPLNSAQQNQKSELEKTPESAVKAFSGVKISEWLPLIDAVRGYFRANILCS